MSDTVLNQTVQPWIKRSLFLLPAILCNFYVTLPAKLDKIITGNSFHIDNNYVWTSLFPLVSNKLQKLLKKSCFWKFNTLCRIWSTIKSNLSLINLQKDQPLWEFLFCPWWYCCYRNKINSFVTSRMQPCLSYSSWMKKIKKLHLSFSVNSETSSSLSGTKMSLVHNQKVWP